jgi:transcriptional regulator of acetoin/glycerol metabolism
MFSGGNSNRPMAILGILRTTDYRKLKELGIE